MNEEAIKESRTIMRLVQEHLLHAHLKLGATIDSVTFVDVVHHAANPAPYLNYVTPRKNTAWVSGSHVEQGLKFMRTIKRTPRVTFVEGLYPPIFLKSLRDLGLDVEQETPIMVYRPKNHPAFQPVQLPENITISKATGQDGIALWWYVWRNAYYEVYTSGIEPLYVGRDMRDITEGALSDVILYRYGFPVGVARITFHDKTAHINAHAIMKEVRTSELTRVLQLVALDIALKAGCELVFTAGETDEARKAYREMGFIDSGSVVCYAEQANHTREEVHDALAQPVLVL